MESLVLQKLPCPACVRSGFRRVVFRLWAMAGCLVSKLRGDYRSAFGLPHGFGGYNGLEAKSGTDNGNSGKGGTAVKPGCLRVGGRRPAVSSELRGQEFSVTTTIVVSYDTPID